MNRTPGRPDSQNPQTRTHRERKTAEVSAPPSRSVAEGPPGWSPALRAFVADAVTRYADHRVKVGPYPDGRLIAELKAYLGDLLAGSASASECHAGPADAACAGHGLTDSRDGVVSGPSVAVGISEAARLLDVSERTVKRLTVAGDLPSTKIRGRRVVARSAIEEYLRGGAA